MQEILFYNIVYAYVCKICEEKFGGCLVVVFVVRSIKSGRLASALCL